jgi:hypothetical protein
MRFFLASCGIDPTSLHKALLAFLPRRMASLASVLDTAWRVISGSAKSPLCELGVDRV